MDAERVVEFGYQAGRKTPDYAAESLDRDRTNLFGLGFRIHVDARHLSPLLKHSGTPAGRWRPWGRCS